MMDSGDALHMAFVALCLAGTAYFFFRQRVDPFTAGFFSSLIYFFPGLIGWTGFSTSAASENYASPLVPGAYAVLCLVIGTIILATIYFDRVTSSKGALCVLADAHFPEVSATLGIIAAVISISHVGKYYLCLDKTVMLEHVDTWYLIAGYAASFCALSSFATKKWLPGMVGIAILAGDVLIGFRGNIAITLIGLLLLTGSWLFAGWSNRIGFVLMVGVFGTLLFLYAQFAWSIKNTFGIDCVRSILSTSAIIDETGNVLLPTQNGVPKNSALVHPISPIAPPILQQRPEPSKRLNVLFKTLSNGSSYVAAFKNAEPMITTAILNEVVRQDFTIPLNRLWLQLVSGIPGSRHLLELGSVATIGFNSDFQPVLFPLVKTFGMASNPWAQAFALGGYLMVETFALAYVFGLAILSWLFNRGDSVCRSVVALLTGWWAFYIHRNDVMVEEQIMSLALIVVIATVLPRLILRLCPRLGRAENI